MTTVTATTATSSAVKSRSAIVPAFFALVLGMGVLVLAGHVQAAALHDAAHDVRHATGFPCH